MNNRRAAAVLAGAVLAIGFIIGVWQLSVDRGFTHVIDGDTVACGSAFSGLADNPDLSGYSDDRSAGYRADCQEKLSTQRTIALVVLGIGALGLAWLVLTARTAPQAGRSAGSDSAEPSARDRRA